MVLSGRPELEIGKIMNKGGNKCSIQVPGGPTNHTSKNPLLDSLPILSTNSNETTPRVSEPKKSKNTRKSAGVQDQRTTYSGSP